jgi:hypothetical protein
MKHFSNKTAEALGYYVYRLIDPRDGQTFYVGKGKNDRVFAHAAQQLEISNDPDIDEDEINLKFQTISEIRSSGLDVIHVIHRHGMDEKTAFEVEAALMDAYAGLSNIAGGHGNSLRGCAHVVELEQQYNAEPAPVDERFIAINVSRSIEEVGGDYYKAVRWQWKISEWRRKMGAPVVAYTNGIIRAVFEIANDGWLPADRPEFNGLQMIRHSDADPGRWGFVSHHTSSSLTNRYLGKRLPDGVRSYGSPLLFLGPQWKVDANS